MSFLDSLWGTGGAGWAAALLQGALVTMEISVGAFAVGLLVGLATALAKLSGGPALVRLANGYTTVCRAVPELLLILLLYYAGTDAVNGLLHLAGASDVNIDGYTAAVTVLGIVQGAYAAEIIRGAVLAIPAGHIEAAKAFGARRHLVVRRIILPEMMPYALAGLSNLWLMLVKDSALISVVGYSELLFTAKQAAGSTKHYLGFYLVTAAVYLAITLVSTSLFKRVERRFGRWMPAN